MSGHHPTKHIATQLVEFMSAFIEDRNGIRNILVNRLNSDPTAKKLCENYIASLRLHSIEDLIHKLVFEGEFAALVIIDEQSERLETILNKGFSFKVEVLELSRYENADGERVYGFEPFLAGLQSEVPVAEGKELGKQMDLSEVDTVVVPARRDGFDKVFLGEKRWYAVRIHASMQKQIKFGSCLPDHAGSCHYTYCSGDKIEPWQDSGKVVLNFSAAPRKIGPIKLLKKGKVRPLYNLRYTSSKKLESAKTLDDAF